MSTYPTIAAYTADVERARNAYAADQAVADGLCAACKSRKKDTPRYRRCKTCRRAGRREGAV